MFLISHHLKLFHVHSKLPFYCASYMLAWYMLSSCVCLSVLSEVGVVPKWFCVGIGYYRSNAPRKPTVVEQLTRFQLTACSRGPSAVAEILVAVNIIGLLRVGLKREAQLLHRDRATLSVDALLAVHSCTNKLVAVADGPRDAVCPPKS